MIPVFRVLPSEDTRRREERPPRKEMRARQNRLIPPSASMRLNVMLSYQHKINERIGKTHHHGQMTSVRGQLPAEKCRFLSLFHEPAAGREGVGTSSQRRHRAIRPTRCKHARHALYVVPPKTPRVAAGTRVYTHGARAREAGERSEHKHPFYYTPIRGKSQQEFYDFSRNRSTGIDGRRQTTGRFSDRNDRAPFVYYSRNHRIPTTPLPDTSPAANQIARRPAARPRVGREGRPSSRGRLLSMMRLASQSISNSSASLCPAPRRMTK